eukprot:173687_1
MSLLQNIDDTLLFIDLATTISSKQYGENIEEKELDNGYPYSLKQFIQWIHFIETKSTVIDLNFDKIENDLKYQYLLYHENKSEYLKQIYYDEENSKLEKKKLFGGSNTIIHYILNELKFSRTKHVMRMTPASFHATGLPESQFNPLIK